MASLPLLTETGTGVGGACVISGSERDAKNSKFYLLGSPSYSNLVMSRTKVPTRTKVTSSPCDCDCPFSFNKDSLFMGASKCLRG